MRQDGRSRATISPLDHFPWEALVRAPASVAVVDRDGLIIQATKQFCRLFEYPPDEISGLEVDSLVPKDLRVQHPGLRESFLAAPIDRLMSRRRDLAGVTKHGLEIPLEISLTPVEIDSVQLTIVWVVDRSEHTALDERFRLAIEGAPSGLVFVDQDGLIVQYNQQACHDFGYDRTELLGQPVEVLTPDSAASEHPAHRLSYLADPKQRPMGHGRELFARRKDGSDFPVEIGLTPIPSPDGTWTMASIVDISERKRAEQAIHEQNDDLLDFVYSASHDLKAPLSTIRGLTAIARDDLEEGDLKSVEELLERVEGRAKKLSDLVEDTLALARSARVEETSETVRLADLLDDVVREIEFAADHAGVRVQVQAPADLAIHASPQRIRLVVDNLLRNSIKYRDPLRSNRYVNILIEETSNRVVMRIEDNGLGIPQSDHHRVFEMFQRFHPGHAEGSGLGLAMVRKQIALLGGSIRFESSPEGTTFLIDLPKEQTP